MSKNVPLQQLSRNFNRIFFTVKRFYDIPFQINNRPDLVIKSSFLGFNAFKRFVDYSVVELIFLRNVVNAGFFTSSLFHPAHSA